MVKKEPRSNQRRKPQRPEKLKAVSFDDIAKTIASALGQLTGEHYQADILRANFDALGSRTRLNGPAEITFAIALEDEQ